MSLSAQDRKNFIGIATDFCYPDGVIKALVNAKTEEECENILTSARKTDNYKKSHCRATSSGKFLV